MAMEEIVNLAENKFFQGSQRVVFVGPSGSGKSQLLLNIIRNRTLLFNQTISEILYINPLLSDGLFRESYFDELEKSFSTIVLKPQFSTEMLKPWMEDPNKHKLLILDDCLTSVPNEDLIALFTRQARHFNISVFLTSQNPFHSKSFVTISRNLTGMFVFNSYDATMLRNLSTKLSPGKNNFLQQCLTQAEKFLPYPYVFLDFQHFNSYTKLSRVWTQILPVDELELKSVFRPILFKQQ